MKKTVSYGKFFNYLCADLMLLLLATQFLPFWPCANCGDCAKDIASISDYVWFPAHHKGVAQFMTEIFGKDYNLNDLVLVPVLILASSVLSIVFCSLKARKPLFAIIPLIGGVAGTYGYLTSPALQAGPGWIFPLILSIAVTVCALVVLSQLVVNFVLKKKNVLATEPKSPKNPKYVAHSSAWSLILAVTTVCITVAMLVIVPML